jgi:hypothetical protein
MVAYLFCLVRGPTASGAHGCFCALYKNIFLYAFIPSFHYSIQQFLERLLQQKTSRHAAKLARKAAGEE